MNKLGLITNLVVSAMIFYRATTEGNFPIFPLVCIAVWFSINVVVCLSAVVKTYIP